MKILASIFAVFILVISLIGVTNLYFLLVILFYEPDPAKEAARIKALSNPCLAEPNLEVMISGEKLTISREVVGTVVAVRSFPRRGKKFPSNVLSPSTDCIEKNLEIRSLRFRQNIFQKQLAPYVENENNYPYYPNVLSIKSHFRSRVPKSVKEYTFWQDLNQDFSFLEGDALALRGPKIKGFIKSKTYTFPDGQPFIWTCPIRLNMEEKTGVCGARYKPHNKNFTISYAISIRDGTKISGAPGHYVPMNEWVRLDKILRKYFASWSDVN